MTLTRDLGLSIRVSMFEYVRLVTGTSSMSDLRFCGKTRGRRPISHKIRKTEEKGGLEIGRGFGPTPVARGGSGAKAPPLAARPVPWNGRGRRLVELTDGCCSEGDSQWLPG